MSNQQDRLRLNTEDKRVLGVCAGIADYLDLPVLLVRVIFVVSILTWPTMIVAYFCLYFCIDRNITSDKVQDFFRNSGASEHIKDLNFRRPIYRNMRNKRIAGVCSGIADYLEVSTTTVRIIAILSLVFGPYTILAYLICWVAIEPNPARRERNRPWKRSRRRRRSRYSDGRTHRGFTSSRINVPEDDQDLMDDPLYEGGDDSDDPLYDPGKKSKNSRYDAELKFTSKSKKTKTSRNSRQQNAEFEKSMEECADRYYQMESRMREIEAFMTSKKFRLHCEINRI
jgi:phage shock protein PspC (stress-responsive transcriptional regulator)